MEAPSSTALRERRITSPVQRLGLILSAVLVGAAGIAYAVWLATLPSPEELALASRKALLQGRRDEALRLASRAVSLYPRSASARIAAAEIELDAHRIDQALLHLERVDYDGTLESLSAIGSSGELLLKEKRFGEAFDRFQRVLAVAPDNYRARQRLALLHFLAGRFAAAREIYFEIVRLKQFDTHELALLGEPEQIYENPDYLDYFKNPDPSNAWLERGLARFALHNQRMEEARARFEELAPRYPDEMEILLGQGTALAESEAPQRFIEWNSRLSSECAARAEAWLARGKFAERRNETQVAIRCYWEALRRNPNERTANHRLAILLHQIGRKGDAETFAERDLLLQSLTQTLSLIHLNADQVDLLLKAADLTQKLGRPWEAWGWYAAVSRHKGNDQYRQRADQIAATLDAATPMTRDAFNPALQIDLSSFPLPKWDAGTVASRDSSSSALVTKRHPVRFTDQASDVGIDFTYINGDDPDVVGMRIWESSGGGVAVLDYDGDSWPDLYFTQGGTYPPRPGVSNPADHFYRNLGNGRFADVTAHANLGDARYSQGVTVGDLDCDGFDDLYVANIGDNCLYRNNGDGTFTDWSQGRGIAGGDWSTSCLMVDLNGDGFPEIYDVTYVAGREPFEHVCHDTTTGSPRICSPAVFTAAQDRLFLNGADGTFADVSSSSGIHAPDGKGLGIVAADFDGSGRLSLYVANDTTPNFLFLNQTTEAGRPPLFLEQAMISGCAVDDYGQAQASMGIAADDADGDGLLDLFVTNFHKESNAFYCLQRGGGFVECSAQARLKEPSLDMLGFGTQYLDGDLDGWPDLVVANGHVDDFRSHGIPFRMRPQYFANLGSGRFAEVPADSAGDYFQQERLGRGMARVDWNRDGREDFVVSNLDTPASLVTNTTPETGHFFALRLRGVASSRDAIGTRVEITAAGRRQVKQLTAGDGYESSNQRQLVFGLAEDTQVAEIVVHWPSGTTQSFQDVAGDREWMLVEGRSELLTIPR